MIVKNLWPVVLLTLVLLVITETFARNPLSIKEYEHNILELSDFEGKKIKHKVRAPASEQNLSEDLQGKRILIEVNEGNEGNGRNEDDGERFKRDITELDESKDAKKSYAKLKLAQTQSILKKWKNKDCGKCFDERTTKKIDKRQANYRNNRISANRSKRYVETRYQLDDKTDYYAQRKAIMERFYARQKEIAEKYAKKSSTIPKYIYNYNLDTKIGTNNVSSTSKVEGNTRETNNVFNDLGASTFVTTTPEPVTETTTKIDRNNYLRQVEPVGNLSEFSNDEEDSDDYLYYFPNDDNNVSDDNDWITDDNRIGTLKWGNCAGKLVYQNNLILTVHDSSFVEANLTATLDGPFCVTCIRAIPMNTTQVNMSFDVSKNDDGVVNLVKVSMRSFYKEDLWYITKVWATNKKNGVCEEMQD